ncbi:hypothetical protein NPIL_270891 [Nephila pilipes]|uniref:DUF7041 domain-containing protein n=1 Tax=Nephila pilipes TaxID=299642 RepID=A0A8X6IEL7_NEPPI|nr:hypothetical protein NPIL_270891 [Nephila pilipes]
MLSTEESAPTASIARVSIKVLPFCRANPEIWFSQMESQFVLARITAEITEFHHVVSVLHPEELGIVGDIILNLQQLSHMLLCELDSAHNMLNQKNSAYVA